MKKITKRFNVVIYLVLFFVAILFSAIPFFEKDTIVKTTDNGFIIQELETTLKVREDNSILISEYYKVKFNDFRHGMIRSVPLTNTFYTKKGRQTQIIKISNIKSTEDYGNIHVNKYSDRIDFKFGNEDKLLAPNTVKTYGLQYVLDLGKDFDSTQDFLYFNVVGIDWTTSIEKLKFEITMPKEFDSSKVEMYTGKYGSKDKFSGYQVNGNVISGLKYNISPHEAVTINLELPENYYSRAEKISFTVSTVALVISVIGIVVALVFLLIKPRAPIMVSPVEFYPPDGYNPVDVSSVYNGEVTTNDITSLIIYFASKGYLKIENNDQEEMILTKLKEIDETRFKSYEVSLFNKLFENGDKLNMTEVIDVSSSYSNELTNLIVNSVKLAEYRSPVRERYNKITYAFMIILLAFAGLGPIIYLFGAEFTIGVNFFVLVSALISLVVMGIILFLLNFKVHKDKTLKMIFNVLLIMHFANYMFAMYSSTFNINFDSFAGKTIISILSAITMFLAFVVLDLSKEASSLLGRVIGFRDFILNCEKDRMDVLLKDDPNYFFDILPYAYVFGITSEFIERFESLGYTIPENIGYTFTDYYLINSLINSNLNTLSTKTASSYRSSKTSGFGGFGGSSGFGSGGRGGGHSGGGFGGGGGSSW